MTKLFMPPLYQNCQMFWFQLIMTFSEDLQRKYKSVMAAMTKLFMRPHQRDIADHCKSAKSQEKISFGKSEFRICKDGN